MGLVSRVRVVVRGLVSAGERARVPIPRLEESKPAQQIINTDKHNSIVDPIPATPTSSPFQPDTRSWPVLTLWRYLRPRPSSPSPALSLLLAEALITSADLPITIKCAPSSLAALASSRCRLRSLRSAAQSSSFSIARGATAIPTTTVRISAPPRTKCAGDMADVDEFGFECVLICLCSHCWSQEEMDTRGDGRSGGWFPGLWRRVGETRGDRRPPSV